MSKLLPEFLLHFRKCFPCRSEIEYEQPCRVGVIIRSDVIVMFSRKKESYRKSAS